MGICWGTPAGSHWRNCMLGTRVSADSAPLEEAVSGLSGRLRPALSESYRGPLRTAHTSIRTAESCTEGETQEGSMLVTQRLSLSPHTPPRIQSWCQVTATLKSRTNVLLWFYMMDLRGMEVSGPKLRCLRQSSHHNI